MHNMWQPRGTPDASGLPLDIQGAFDKGKGISTGLVLWPADLRWLLVAGCGGMWQVFFSECYRRTWRRSIRRFWANLSHHRLHPATKVSISLMNLVTAVMVPCLNILMSGVCFGHNLWYVCGNYQVAGIEDSQSKQGTVLADATEPEPPRSFRTTFLECCCSKVEGALEHARQEKEKLGAWCAQLGKSTYLGRGFAWSAGKWIASSAGEWIAWNAERWHVQTHKRYIAL